LVAEVVVEIMADALVELVELAVEAPVEMVQVQELEV
jgi:hypothetical protein